MFLCSLIESYAQKKKAIKQVELLSVLNGAYILTYIYAESVLLLPKWCPDIQLDAFLCIKGFNKTGHYFKITYI